MAKNAWRGDWQRKIYQRVRERGIDSVTSYADTMPQASLLELAASLGSDVVAAQLEEILLDEAKQSHQLPYFLRSLLARRIHQAVPGGWNRSATEEFQSQLATGWSAWAWIAERVLSEDELDRVWDNLRSVSVPDGWLPEGPNDPVIVAVLRGIRLAADA